MLTKMILCTFKTCNWYFKASQTMQVGQTVTQLNEDTAPSKELTPQFNIIANTRSLKTLYANLISMSMMGVIYYLMIIGWYGREVLLYGSETWRTTKKTTRKVKTFINNCHRRILKYTSQKPLAHWNWNK